MSSSRIPTSTELKLQSMEKIDDDKVGSKESKAQEKEEEKEVGFFELFRFSTQFDYILMIVGTIASIAMGVAMPSFAFIWGDIMDDFQVSDSNGDQMVERTKSSMLTFIYVGVGAFFAGWIMFACWMITGERQAIACRKAYLNNLLKQEIGWFDLNNQTQLASKFSTDTFSFSGAIGEKISTIIMTFSTLVAGFVFAFVTGWLMSFVMLATLPVIFLTGIFYMKVIKDKEKNQNEKYSNAGGRAEQAISSIKTIKQLNGQEFQGMQYKELLLKASANSGKYALYAGLGVGGLFFAILATYSLGFWFGSRCVMQADNCSNDVARQTYTTGDVLVIFFSILMPGFNLSQLHPAFKKITEGKRAASRIYAVIDRVPLITSKPNAITPQNVKGQFVFENVTFSYPKDPSYKILNKLNLTLHPNKTGLVGQSGCGKSTVLQLIMRFYDPEEGRITLDGVDLRDLNLEWLRSQIGYVGQEPVLFATSIKENLMFGKDITTEEQIENALKKAEAYDFVQNLDDKMETFVGYGGGQLSGGQKQRIAIARAILRKPKILLLDEATSALDRRNQKLIQKTFDSITQGLTTVTVAHRVKTIMGSDMIYVLQKGGIKEKGKFNEIQMFKKQQSVNNQEDEDEQNQATLNNGKMNNNDGNLELHMKEDDFQPIAKEELQKKEKKVLEEKYEKDIFSRLFGFSKEKKLFFICGVVMSLANGVIFPIFSIFLSRMLIKLLTIQISVASNQQISQDIIDDVNLYALLFLIFAIASFVITTIQIASMTLVGEEITRKIRIQTFNKILVMPVPWFDKPRNNSGQLAARLSTDCELVNTATTTIVSIQIQNLSTLISGIVIAFVFQWRTSLVALALLPLMIICGVVQMQFMTGFSDETDSAYKGSVNLITESITNIRTVSSFGYDSVISRKYDKRMEEPMSLTVKKGNISGLLFGLSQMIMFSIFGILFYVGSLFVRQFEDATTEDMFTAVFAILFAGMTAGNNQHFVPDQAQLKNSAINLFTIQDGEDENQIQIQQKSRMLKEGINGDIEIKNIDFKYESRKQDVFQNMSLTIKKGNKVALVGTSGCGKSTILQLLQRFYIPQSGQILINDIDIKDFDIHYLRSVFGVVSQEPVLFNGSFRENIKYNLENVAQEQIRKSAIQANAITFIQGKEEMTNQKAEKQEENNHKGFDKNVGVRGSHISGGQKQRVAIARTIVRNPEFLMLDEATSALDKQNEKKVQDSLDSIMKGKTVISIAHRIDTIKNSDIIYMFDKGQIVEQGSYEELIKKEGYFYNLERGARFT